FRPVGDGVKRRAHDADLKGMVVIRSPSPQLVPFKLHRFGKQRPYLASFDYIKRMRPDYKVDGVASRFKKMAESMLDSLKDDDDPRAILDSENLNTRITITHNGKIKSENSILGADRLKDAAVSLVDTELSGYTIITKSDKKITHDEIVLRNKVLVRAHGKSVDRDEMWNKLVEILIKYDREKILEH
ncbi:hypothetical protein ACEUAZ_14500, partial [Aeromonas veronii]